MIRAASAAVTELREWHLVHLSMDHGSVQESAAGTSRPSCRGAATRSVVEGSSAVAPRATMLEQPICCVCREPAEPPMHWPGQIVVAQIAKGIAESASRASSFAAFPTRLRPWRSATGLKWERPDGYCVPASLGMSYVLRTLKAALARRGSKIIHLVGTGSICRCPPASVRSPQHLL
jgi:hypothetical protein